jgi:hypothetical protein
MQTTLFTCRTTRGPVAGFSSSNSCAPCRCQEEERVQIRADTVTAAQQEVAFAQFVNRAPCLRRQRGRIMERNSCREPWSHTTSASVRQSIPIGRRSMDVELDVFNVLNVLNADWGQRRIAAPRLLEHVGQSATSQPIFRFDATRPTWTLVETESAFQLQLALRLHF